MQFHLLVVWFNLVHAYKFHGYLKTAQEVFLKTWQSRDLKHQFTSPLSFKDIETKEGYYLNGTSKINTCFHKSSSVQN